MLLFSRFYLFIIITYSRVHICGVLTLLSSLSKMQTKMQENMSAMIYAHHLQDISVYFHLLYLKA